MQKTPRAMEEPESLLSFIPHFDFITHIFPTPNNENMTELLLLDFHYSPLFAQLVNKAPTTSHQL